MSIQDLTFAALDQELARSLLMGILVASAFPIGAAVAVTRKFPRQIKGNLAAIAAGIYFSTLAFSLVEEGIRVSSFPTMATGFVIGALTFGIAHPIVKERKELSRILSLTSDRDTQEKTPKKPGASGAEMNIVGTALDSVPENLFIGAIIAMHLPGLSAALIALFLGNLTATIDGAQRMFDRGMDRSQIFRKWIVDFAIVAPAGLIGWYLVKPLGEGGGWSHHRLCRRRIAGICDSGPDTKGVQRGKVAYRPIHNSGAHYGACRLSLPWVTTHIASRQPIPNYF